MKKLTLFLAFFCLSLTVNFAQRLDDITFTHNYLRLPLTPLQGTFKTYSVLLDPGTINLAKMGMIESAMMKNYFALEQYEYVKTGGDFLILVTLDGDHFVSKELKKEIKTEGKGETAKKVTHYSYEVKFRTPITYAIYDGKREVMVEKIYSGYDRIIARSFGDELYTTNLDKAWNNSGEAQLETWVKEDFSMLMAKLSNHLMGSFDTRPGSRKVTFYSMKNADKIGYEAMAEAVPALKPVIEGASVEKPLSLADFGDNMATWESALASADPSDKKESVAFQAAAFNLAMAHALVGNFDEAVAFSARVEETGRKEYITKTVNEIIEDSQKRMVANQDIPQIFVGTYDQAADEAFMAARIPQVVAATQVIQLPDFVVLAEKQDTLFGVVSYEYKIVRGTDGETKTLRGLWLEDATDPSQAKRHFETDEFILVRKDNIQYMKVFLGVGPLGILTLQEPLHSTKDLILSRFEESPSKYSHFLTHLTTKDNGKETVKVYGLDDGMAFLNLNKGLSGKFEDCPTIFQKAQNEEYSSNETSYRQVVDDYSTCNQ